MTPPATRKRLMLGLFGLSVLAAALAIFWPSERQSVGHSVTYSDGTKLTLKEVTYGTEHRYRGGGLRERIISLLPRKYAAKFVSRRSALRTNRPSIAFWFERHGTAPTTGDLVLCDGSGFGIGEDFSMMRLAPPDNGIEGWAFEAWPRREPNFTVRVYERGVRYPDAKLLGEFTVQNPKPGNYPQWTALPLPLTATNGDLSVTLFDLTAGVGLGSNKWAPAPNPTVSQTRAGFRVKWNGLAPKEWEITSVEASDATGNAITTFRGASWEQGAEFAELQPHLWPAESAWKLRVGFSRRANFASNDLWTIRDIALSATNSSVRQTHLQGVLVQFIGQARHTGLRGSHHFNFRMTPGGQEYRLTLIRALSDRGGGTAAGWFESPRDWSFALDINPKATSLEELTLALQRTRYVEFLARPQLVTTNRALPGLGRFMAPRRVQSLEVETFHEPAVGRAVPGEPFGLRLGGTPGGEQGDRNSGPQFLTCRRIWILP